MVGIFWRTPLLLATKARIRTCLPFQTIQCTTHRLLLAKKVKLGMSLKFQHIWYTELLYMYQSVPYTLKFKLV